MKRLGVILKFEYLIIFFLCFWKFNIIIKIGLNVWGGKLVYMYVLSKFIFILFKRG